MPVRNAARTLPATLQSIRRQTTREWELIAVDDGSTDETLELLQATVRGGVPGTVLTQEPLGIVSALQRACAAATGELIARMDADDTMIPDRLALQASYLREHPEIGVVACNVRFGGDPNAQAGYAAHVQWLNALTPGQIFLRRFVESPVAHPTVMFRRALLEHHGGYAAGDFPEDYELWLRWMEAGVRFGKVDGELVTWNDPPGRLSRRDERYRPQAFYRIKCQYLARWLNRALGSEREVWLRGAGRVTRQRFRSLESEGVRIAGFVDVDSKKLGRMAGRLSHPAASRPGTGPLLLQP